MLYRDGLISDAVLEDYRICSPLDRQNPVTLLSTQKLPLPKQANVTAQSAVRDLLAAIDTHLATLSGPGVAEVRAGLNASWLGPVSPGGGLETPALIANLDLIDPMLASTIKDASPHLHWPPGQHFAALIGENGPWRATDFALGLYITSAPANADFYTPLTPGLGIYVRTAIVDKSR